MTQAQRRFEVLTIGLFTLAVCVTSPVWLLLDASMVGAHSLYTDTKWLVGEVPEIVRQLVKAWRK